MKPTYHVFKARHELVVMLGKLLLSCVSNAGNGRDNLLQYQLVSLGHQLVELGLQHLLEPGHDVWEVREQDVLGAVLAEVDQGGAAVGLDSWVS